MTTDQNPGQTRREFVTAAASSAAALTILPRHVLGGPRFVAPSDRVNVAVIGVGGQGRENVRALLEEKDCRIVAVADACEAWDLSPFYYGGMAGRAPVKALIEERYRRSSPGYACAAYEDFRVMLEKEKAIDAVLVATPDHLHAYVSILAMKAGKHVYCEKPLTHDVWEARAVARVARETGVATQMGNAGRSGEGHRLTAEWIWDGAIGAVHEVHAWSGAGFFASGHGRPRETPPVPPGLNWDLWLGPAEARPYHPAYAPFSWRGWWAFGGGGIADMATHNLDPAFNALELDAPETVEASGPGIDEEVCSTGVLATYRYSARGARGPLTVCWYDGGLRPPTPADLDPDDPKQRLGEGDNGIFFVGEKGIITCGGWSGMPRLLPLELHRTYERPPKTIPRIAGGHHASWLQACKGGPPASSNFGYSARLTEAFILGTAALRARKVIKWDAANMTFTSTPDADRYLRRAYRNGWELPL